LQPVADHADVEAIEDGVAFDAAQDEGVEQVIDGVGDGLGLGLALPAADQFEHRLGLVNQEEETGRVDAADFRGIGHGDRLTNRTTRSARGKAAHSPGNGSLPGAG